MPEWKTLIRERLADLRIDPSREAEILEELSQHLDERYQELLRDGRPEVEARTRAVEELVEPDVLGADMSRLKQAHAPEPIAPGAPHGAVVADLWQDLRYATRMLRRQPGFTITAILTLALGIGVNSAIFALVDAVLLRPLPFADAHRLVHLAERTSTSRDEGVSPLNLLDWQAQGRSIEMAGGFVQGVGGMVLAHADGTTTEVPRQWVTARYFDALGLRPVAGRFFTDADDRAQSNVVVLTESFWRTQFNGDSGIIGSVVRLDGDPWTVVGVAPDEAQLLPTSMWGMRSILGAPPRVRGVHFLGAVARLKPDVTLEAAQADLDAVAATLSREYPATNADRGVVVTPLRDRLIGGDLKETAMLFLGVVGVVLLICCANIANLLLARASSRTKELAVRVALGADRVRLVRQLLTESVLLSLVGGAIGIVIGAAIVRVAPALIPADLLPASVTLAFNLRVVAVCAGVAIGVGVLFGLAPAWQASRADAREGLTAETRSVIGHGGALRRVLVAGEVATAVLLLFGAGLLLRTLLAVGAVDRGYRASEVVTMMVDPPGSVAADDAAELRFYESLEREIAPLPGVASVAWATTLPMGVSYQGAIAFEIEGRPVTERARPTADYQVVSPSYFSTLDLPLTSGRTFDERDAASAVKVCIVNEAFARRHLPGESPIGKRVAIRSVDAQDSTPVVREIVGVARQVKGRPDEAQDLLQVYIPLAQDTPGDLFLLVRARSGRAADLATSIRAAIGRVDSRQVVSVRDVTTLDEIMSLATSRHRFRATLVGAFAVLALALAMVGLFGLMAYTVQQRTRELGLRRALGATAGGIVRVVVAGVARVSLTGAVIGLVLAAMLGRVMTTMLFGVTPLDAWTFAGVVALVLSTTLVAAVAPAVRALRVDPAAVLRE